MPDAKLKKNTFFCVVEETLQVIKNLERENELEREIYLNILASHAVVQLAGMSSSEQYIILKAYTCTVFHTKRSKNPFFTFW